MRRYMGLGGIFVGLAIGSMSGCADEEPGSETSGHTNGGQMHDTDPSGMAPADPAGAAGAIGAAGSGGAAGSSAQNPGDGGTNGHDAGPGSDDETIRPGVGPGGCAQFVSSFQAIQKVIFEGHGCTAQACHGEKKEGGLDLRPGVAYENLVDARSTNSKLARVQPGTANESYLYLKLRAATEPDSVEIAGSPMPVGQPALTARELAAVDLWIKKGAPETGFTADGVTLEDVGSLLDSCEQPLEPITVKPLDAPAADEGIQFILPTYMLEAASEISGCVEFAYDFTDKVPARFKDEARNVMFVNSSRVRQDAQSHHMGLYNRGRTLNQLTGDFSTWTCREGDHDGASCDPSKGSADCGDLGVCADAPAFGFGCASPGGETQLANSQAPQQYVPPIDGLYWEVPLNGVLSFDTHAFNLTDQDTRLHARINFYYTDNLVRKLVPANIIDNVFIAAGQPPFTRDSYCGNYVVPQGDSITVMTFHTHRRGERSWVTHPTLGVIYENFDYNDPLYKEFEPWLDFDSPSAADRTLEYCATYSNGLTPDGEPDLELVARNSRMPPGKTCPPVACVAGKVAEACFTDADCDSAAGAGDGYCDACAITAGTTTEDEMFVLMPWLAKPPAN